MTLPNKIKNPQTPPPEKSSFSDNEFLRTALATEKNLCNSYTTAMLGASHEKLFIIIFGMLKETAQQHRKLVDLQFQHGWLSLTPVSSEEVKALVQEFTDAMQQIE